MNAWKVLKKASEEKFALGAFNVANIETFKAITQAAKKLNSPIILEASDGEVNYIGYHQLVALVRVYESEIGIPIILNLDHGKDFDSCKKAVEAGFDYIHIDTSQRDYDEGIEIARAVVELAHKHNLPVEGEMDHIEGSSADHRNETPGKLQDPKLYTNPDKAGEFVKATGIDVFASFVGNLHGIYASEAHLNLALLKEIRKKLPNTLLSLHGGSGLYDSDVMESIQNGVIKVNVNSDMRIAFKMTLQEALNATNEVAVYKIMDKPIEAVQKVVENKIRLFGSENKFPL